MTKRANRPEHPIDRPLLKSSGTHYWIHLKQRASLIPVQCSLGCVFFVLGIALIGLAGVDADNNLLMIIFGLCVAGLILNLFSAWRTLRGLSVQRIVPDVLVAGQPFVIRYSVTNIRRWSCARCIHLQDVLPSSGPMADPEAFISVLHPGETVTLNVPAISRLRGRIKFSMIRLATSFPFGALTKVVTIHREHEVAVFPALGRLLADVKAASRSSDASSGEGVPARMIGDEEFYGVREYRIGDNPRRIHWRRSARTGQLMIREMARTREHQLWCVVNTRIDPHDPEQADRLELVMSCAATVICDVLERGVKIGLVCNGQPLLVLPPTGGRARRLSLLRELAIRDMNTDDPLAPHIERLAWPARWRGPCMLFGTAADDDLTSAARFLGWAVGPTTTYVPGRPAFGDLFRLEDASIRVFRHAHVTASASRRIPYSLNVEIPNT